MIGSAGDDSYEVRSSELVYELRTGDFRHVGLGQMRPIVATVDYRIVLLDGQPMIALMKIILLDRDTALDNLTFIL